MERLDRRVCIVRGRDRWRWTRYDAWDGGVTAHNPEVAGSNPAPATRNGPSGSSPRRAVFPFQGPVARAALQIVHPASPLECGRFRPGCNQICNQLARFGVSLRFIGRHAPAVAEDHAGDLLGRRSVPSGRWVCVNGQRVGHRRPGSGRVARRTVGYRGAVGVARSPALRWWGLWRRVHRPDWPASVEWLAVTRADALLPPKNAMPGLTSGRISRSWRRWASLAVRSMNTGPAGERIGRRASSRRMRRRPGHRFRG